MTSAAEQSSIRRVIAVTCLLGAAASLVVVALGLTAWADITGSPALTDAEWIAFFATLTTLGQIVFVKVRHGATTEELTFYEVVLAAAILLLSPSSALAAMLTGMLLGELIRRRPTIKIAFNLGNYALSTSAMILTYHALDTINHDPGVRDPLSLHSMVSLLVASGVFTAVNLSGLAQLFHVTSGATRREVFAEEWRLSAFMAIGSSGIGAVSVALASSEATRALVPFAFIPVIALWYAYGASAAHAEARERNRWLVTLGGALARHGQGESTLEESTEAVRQIVAAPQMLILQPHGDPATMDARTGALLTSVWSDPGPRPLAEHELPPGWRTGVVTRLDLGTANPGALLLGSTAPYRPSRIAGRTQGWNLDDADAPVLGALVAAVGSSMRAGAAFDALTEETEKLTAVVDNTSDGIAVIDDSGAVRLWSRTMARMTGVRAQDLGAAPDDAPPIVRTLVSAAQTADSAPGTPPIPVHLIRSDGEELDISLAVVRVREAASSGSPEPPGWVRILTVHDETRERHVERLKTDFVARVSHELRTPITPIKGYSRLLLSRGDRIDPHRRTKALQVISDRADHLSRLVDDLLQVSQASNSNRWAITTTMRVADLTGIVEKASAGFPEMAKRIRMSLPEGPVMVQCDPDRALQCLTNLITNAQKYALPSSPVDIWIETRGHEATVHVRDHGPGIPESEREKVFLQFYRREDPFTMRTGGAGLGLHIARDFAMAMGGALTLRAPSDGAGSEFVLHLRSADVPALRSPDSPPPLDGSVPALHEARPSETSPAHARTSAPPDLISVESPGEGADTPDLDGDLAPELADGGTMEPGAGRRAAM